jgi:serine/threonine protein phosphatase PrpC
MVEEILLAVSIFFIVFFIIVYFRFKITPKKKEIEKIATQITEIITYNEKLAKIDYVTENFAKSIELKKISDFFNEKIDKSENEIQIIMDKLSEQERINELKLSIEDSKAGFVTKEDADEKFVTKKDEISSKNEILKQLELIAYNLSDLQNSVSQINSESIPDSNSQLVEKVKILFDKYKTDILEQLSKIDISQYKRDELESIAKDVYSIVENTENVKPISKENIKEILSESSSIENPQNTSNSFIEKAPNLKHDAQNKDKQIFLSNGKINQPYAFSFDINSLGISEIGEFEFNGLESIGLSYDKESKLIKGIPTHSGEHKLKIEIKRTDWTEGKPILSREIIIFINSDPKSLWNDIPTPTDIEYYKPDCDKLFVKVEAENGEARKDMVAASQRGRSHAHEGKARDDDFQLYYDKYNDWYILSVADGAGSAKSSRKGSQIATKVAVEVCKTQIAEHNEEFCKLIKGFNEDKSDENRKKFGDYLYTIVGTSIFKAYKAIENEAMMVGKPVKDFSTTLVFSICKKFSFGWFVGAYWVGDGGIGIYNKDTQFLKVLGETDGGEFAGQTRFLTMPGMTEPTELYRRLRFDIVDDFTALILMSDGITDPKFETDANLLRIEKWNELWEDLSNEVDFTDDNEASADQLLKWLDFWSPGNHDDRTIAILY